jgi:hypothetical protein
VAYVKDTSIAFPIRYKMEIKDFFADGTQNGPTGGFNSTKVVKAVRTREGESLPKWKSIIKSGGNATTPLSGVKDELWSHQISAMSKWLNVNNGTFRITTYKGDRAAYNLPWGPNGSSFGLMIDSSNADNQARARFYKKLREVQVAFSGPTFLGELRETLRMIKRPAQAIRDSCDRYYRSLKQWKGRNRPPSDGHRKWDWRRELVKTAGGLWLENSFGWQPLLNDIKDAVEAYERLTPPIANVKTISVGGKDAADQRTAYAGSGWGDSGSDVGDFLCYLYLARAYCTVRYKGKVSLTTEATKWDNLALFGFTPSEFVPTAWELLPWSFLIDYFTNIGDILTSAVTRTAPVNFVNQTVRKNVILLGKQESNLSDISKRPGGFPWDWSLVEHKSGSAAWYATRSSILRASGSGVSLPTFTFEPGLNLGQMANISALLTQMGDVHPQDKPRRNWHR